MTHIVDQIKNQKCNQTNNTLQGFKFRLGSGETSLWFNNQSAAGIMCQKVSFVIEDIDLCLKNLIHEGHWNINDLHTRVPQNFVEMLEAIDTNIHPDIRDYWIQSSSSNGDYSAASGYKWLSNSLPSSTADHYASFKWLQKLKVPRKIHIMIQLILHNSLPTNAVGFRRNMANNAACPTYSNPIEDFLHCLRDCYFLPIIILGLDHNSQVLIAISLWLPFGGFGNDVIIIFLKQTYGVSNMLLRIYNTLMMIQYSLCFSFPQNKKKTNNTNIAYVPVTMTPPIGVINVFLVPDDFKEIDSCTWWRILVMI